MTANIHVGDRLRDLRHVAGDALAASAAALMMREPKSYEAKVKGVLHAHLGIIPVEIQGLMKYVQSTCRNMRPKTRPMKQVKTTSQKTK